jgi:hypothetical protein
MHIISEFSSLVAFLDPSRIWFALYSFMDCPNHKANDYEGKNGATSDSFPSAKL